MKKIFFSLILCLISLFVFSQARNSSVEYLKVKRDAVSIDLPFTEKTVSNAIVDEFQKRGYKGKENKGFMVFKEVKMREMGDKALDYYFLTEKKSKKEKDATTLSLALSENLDQFIEESSDANVLNDAKKFLDDFRNIVYYYDIEEQIKSQQEVIVKSEKKLTSLVEDGKDLEKKKKKIEEQIDANTQNQASQKNDVEAQKQILDKLKEKRRS
jgi:hypothetical protein